MKWYEYIASIVFSVSAALLLTYAVVSVLAFMVGGVNG